LGSLDPSKCITLHRTITNTIFFLTYRLDHRTPFFNSTTDYNENVVSDLIRRMSIAREIANKQNLRLMRKITTENKFFMNPKRVTL
jgi:hypothetical protein